MRVSTPFNHHVPKNLRANLKWRSAVHRKVMEDPDYASVIRDACSKDPLFFINGFGYTYDPRDHCPFPKLPFILYPFQEDAILKLIRATGSRDILVEKSRDMGASWMCIVALLWGWMYRAMQSYLFVSRVEDYVDKPGNPKALFWKFDFFVMNLPIWLRPKGYNPKDHRRKLHVENPENGSVIDGESTTSRVARGDRRGAILLDEFAAVEQGHQVLSATRDATPCRIFNSTPEGTGNAFYDIRQTDIEKLRLHWSLHPVKSPGLYTTDEHGKLKVLDSASYPFDYKPILDGKLRSPWYDNECKRAASVKEIAQELDIDYLGSGYQFFNADLVRTAIREHARPPVIIGDLEYDEETGEPIEFREDPSGHLRLWFFLDKDGKPPKDCKYSLGVDVSAGTGASNSTGCGWNTVTCEKAFEYANPYIRPEALAKQMVAIARWANKAFLIWENGGPGRQFGDRVVELKYRNFYLRKREEALSKRTSDIPGIAQTREVKTSLLSVYRAAIEKGYAVNRSKEALEETLEYIFGSDGGVVHSRAASKTDPSGAKSNHGDRAMGDALAWKGVWEQPRGDPKGTKPEIPIGCLAWRQKMRKEAESKPNRELDKTWRN